MAISSSSQCGRRFAAERDHGVGRRVRRAAHGQGVGKPDRGGLSQPDHQRIIRGKARLVGRGAVGGHQLERSARCVAQVERAPFQPEHLGRRLEQPAAQRHSVDQTPHRQPHLLHRPIELVLLAEELPVDHPLKPAARHLGENQDHDHRQRPPQPPRARSSGSRTTGRRSICR